MSDGGLIFYGDDPYALLDDPNPENPYLDQALESYYPAARDNLVSQFFFSLIALIMPIRVITYSVHNYLTRRDYTYSIDDLSDLVVAVCVSVWIWTYVEWADVVTDSRFEATKADRYTWQVMEHDNLGDFKMLPFLAAMVVFLWLRFLLMLQLTKTFGPMLRILISMFTEVFKFIFIWLIVIICFTSVASLLFGELVAYRNFTEVIFTVFSSALGNYEFSDFADLSMGMIVGEIFIVIVVLVQNIVLLNFVIAIQADTYTKLTSESLGIYYDGIIARIPIYEDDSRYGGLIVGTPPFNLLAVFMIPFYCCTKDERKLRWGNDLFTRLMFAPMAVIITMFFMAINLILLPFAYFAAIVSKV